jgi:hypothetical protein
MAQDARNESGTVATGVHLPFARIPEAVRAWAEGVGGGAVVRARDLVGGFSPGCCTLVEFAGGGRAFVKAVGSALNPTSPSIHRREAAITAALPRLPQTPVLIDAYDDGDWVALMFEEVPGALPRVPWREDELERVVRALAELHDALTPCPIEGMEPASVRLDDVLTGWRSLSQGAEGVPLEGWVRRNLDRLVELEAAAPAALDGGETLLHADIRSDNVLLSEDRVVFVDWPHAASGAAGLDVVGWAPSVQLEGGGDPEALIGRYRPADDWDPDALNAMVAAIAGYFTHHATLPDPPGLPTLRAFQRAQGEVARAWLRERTRWR